ncbi:helix-turn-helix transcriptional regulator [Kitasatospora aureofaciens]|uniref:helix-turn-helix domain-containing protein n=1 Tax=Kitasatospora aureofaciens TaxID=1894 RepID=UPI001C478DEF|nr:helix-turn-helix transcriptional regulator [Kitasatospora aureofaciens]MBV6696903.1 helix-turn-helix domain-containing protein [Kitasatospora aureofaciens]
MSEELAEQLRQLRDLTGRSLRELAREVRGSSSSLSRYFAGQTVPPWPTVVALCRTAGRDPRPMREVWERARSGAAPSAAAAPPVRNELPHDVAPPGSVSPLLPPLLHTHAVASTIIDSKLARASPV